MKIQIEEAARLQTLSRYAALDIFGESIYENITEVASLLCKKPVSVISMIDSEKLWMKSAHNAPIGSMARNRSFCDKTIQNSKEAFVVNNAALDPIFADAPLVVGGPMIKFYAGVPLVAPNGHVIGTLSVVDQSPGEITADQLRVLKILGKHVMSILNSKLNELNLIHKSKMVTLGEMAGGIAHEINNPITIISGFSIKLIEELEKDKFDKEKLLINLKKIRDNAQRVALIIKGLKDFSVQGDDNTIIENILVQKIIDDTLSLCAEKFGARKIQLKLNIVANLKAHCRPTQISQVLMNLLNNCYDALEDQKNPQIEITAKKIKESVIINIIDNGTGIPKAIQDKIMQPFFTTKEISKGVGLGLSISQGLVEANEGTLRFDPDSSPTCFELMLKPASS